MNCLLVILSAVLAILPLDETPYKDYIEKYASVAVAEMHRSGVPASITLAQGLLESRAGQSRLAVEGNNHFGIKCHRGWTGRTIREDDDARNECFRAYDDALQSFRDHSDYLRYNDRYKSLFNNKQGDYKAWAHGLKAAGYATDPAYPGKLIDLIERFNLSRFDKVNGEIEPLPDSPLSMEEAVKVEDEVSATTVKGEQVKTGTAYSETVGVSFGRLFRKNGVECVFALEGETYKSIASQYGLSLRKLLEINELKKQEPLTPGTVVYISPKKKQTEKGLDKYIVGEEPQTLRAISQRFGVKLSSLLKMNGFDADYQPVCGDEILLRR